MAQFADNSAASIFSVSSLLLRNAGAWRLAFGSDNVDERYWLIFSALAKTRPDEQYAIRNLRVPFLDLFGADDRAVDRELRRLAEQQLVAVDNETIKALGKLRELSAQYHQYTVTNVLDCVERELGVRHRPFDPSPTDDIHRSVIALWEQVASDWKDALKRLESVIGLGSASNAAIVDRLVTASYWFVLIHLWRREHLILNNLRRRPLTRDRIAAKLNNCMDLMFDATKQRLASLKSHNFIYEVRLNRRLGYRIAEPAYLSINEFLRCLEGRLRDFHGSLAPKWGEVIPLHSADQRVP